VRRISNLALDKINPVRPPTVNKKINPSTHDKRGVVKNTPPLKVATQEKTLTPVGIAITIVAVVK